MRYWALILTAALLSACASTAPVYTQSGQRGYLLTCSGWARNWGMCYQKAGQLCGVRGYTVLSKDGEKTVAYTPLPTVITNRQMTVQCGAPVAAK